MNIRGLASIYAMMATFGSVGSFSRTENNYRPSDKVHPNERKKCFRKECTNHRNGHTELFCSEKCKKLYRDEVSQR